MAETVSETERRSTTSSRRCDTRGAPGPLTPGVPPDLAGRALPDTGAVSPDPAEPAADQLDALPDALLDELLELATATARSAGDVALEMRAGIRSEGTKSSPTDVVTAADRAVERLVVDAVRRARPEDGLLGEEGGGWTGSSGLRWVVDPIDGTVNHLYGLPQWAVSIAVETGTGRGRRSQVGVVLDPAKGELFTAVRGRGSRLDGQPLACNQVSSLDQTLVATGFGYDAGRRAVQAGLLAAVLPAVRDIRRVGAGALDLCAVAAGRVDAYYEQGLSPWDLAAGGLVATEAGARLGGLRGLPAGYPMTLAASPGVFDALHDLLAEHDADADPVGDFRRPDPFDW